MKNALLFLLFFSFSTLFGAEPDKDGYILVWHDEFDTDGPVDSQNWNYEEGFVRNLESQWYQPQNAWCRNGLLTITARPEFRPNPNYNSKSHDWGKLRKNITLTSASVTTRGKHEFLYGRFEVRARIPATPGTWPSIWLLGSKYPWPSCGEIDMMEYYNYKGEPHLLANVCWAGYENTSKWNTAAYPYAKFKAIDPLWDARFHVWRMDWDKWSIRLYMDDKLMNETSLTQTINAPTSAGADDNPFETPMYILLNLAMGSNGGKIDETTLPAKYEIDYVRVYQKL